MVGHGGSSAGSYLADPTSPIPSHCAVIILFKKCPSASIVVTSTLRVKGHLHTSSLSFFFYIYLQNCFINIAHHTLQCKLRIFSDNPYETVQQINAGLI